MKRCNRELLAQVVGSIGKNGIAIFATKANVSVSTVSLGLRGHAPKKLTTMMEMARAANCSVDDLFPSADRPARRQRTGGASEEEAS